MIEQIAKDMEFHRQNIKRELLNALRDTVVSLFAFFGFHATIRFQPNNPRGEPCYYCGYDGDDVKASPIVVDGRVIDTILVCEACRIEDTDYP